ATTITANAADGGLQFINATKNSIEIPDNKENALIIENADGDDAFMSFDSRNGAEKITFSKPVAFTGGISNPGTVATTDIDGGTIDGTAIGALSQAAGDFTAIGAVAAGTIVGTTIDATTDFTIGTLVVTDNQIQMTPSTDDVVTIAGATNGILNITTVDDAGTSGDVNLTADGQIEYRANDAAGHIFDIAGTDQLSITDGVIAPVTNNDIALGTTALSYSDLFLADGSVLNLDNGDITLTHSDAKLTLGGDDAVEFDFATHEMTNVDINSGDIDGVRIGYNSGRGGKFTNLWIGGGGSTGDLWLMDADNSNGVSLKGPDDVGSNYSLTFPAADGNANQVLKTDGNGILSWADNASRPVAPGTPNSSSDRRFKKNISTVSGALQKLSKLNPVNYDWRQDEFEHKGFGDKKQWGFIAQEIKEIFPELVGKDDEDFLTLNYQGFVPLLTKAVQEQQEEIDSQQKEIDALKSQLQMIMDMLDNDMSDKTDSKKDNDNKKPVKLSMATQK
ncbi:MAG: tail fiber domain-containing protein, partial [Candidatus Marinimicrobia bacterium]|nr:tail fiber domain-containing protein [Candidatus Neomarinimicrobiota bacterium]